MLPFRYCGLEIKILHYCTLSASLVARSVKNLPAVQVTQGQTLCWEHPLENETAMHYSILSGKISWTVQSMGSQRVRPD